MAHLDGKTVMITGASRGIGAATAREFAAGGANVALLARTTGEINELAAEIGGGAIALSCDVSRFGDMQSAHDATIKAFGRVDILINNAGMIEPISLIETSDPGAWGHAIDVNLKGVYHGIRAVLPGMRAAGGGTVLTVSSGAAYGPIEAWSAYCTSKAGAAMLLRSLDEEYSSDGIRAIGLSPGTVATKMQRDIKASGINRISELEWSDHIPAEWPARTLAWMCSAAADEFIGQDINLREDDIRRRVGLIE